jgi:beta-phosphoglucomutase
MQIAPPIQALIFDMDGVLIDSHAAHRAAWREFNLRLGQDVSESQLDFVLEGRKREEIIRYFVGDVSPEDLVRYGRMKDDLFRERAGEIRAIPGLVRFLEDAATAKLKLAVGTSATADRARHMLEQLDLIRFFRVVITGADVQNGKPSPDIFRKAADELHVACETAVVIEDSVAGVQAAITAGMRCVGIANEQRRELLREAGAQIVVADFTELAISTLKETKFCLVTA